jgi:hypothetical protein
VPCGRRPCAVYARRSWAPYGGPVSHRLPPLHNLPTERMDFPARFFRAWALPTLLEYQVRTLAPSGIASKLTLHMESLGGGVFFAALARSPTVWVCLPVLDEPSGGCGIARAGVRTYPFEASSACLPRIVQPKTWLYDLRCGAGVH